MMKNLTTMENSNEKVTNTGNAQRSKLERLLVDLKFDYKKLNVDLDFDFYDVYINLDKIGQIKIILLQPNNGKELFTMCQNVYRLKPTDSVLSILSALNKANSKLSGGSVTLDDDGNVKYRRLDQFDRNDSITKVKLINIFNDVIASIIYTADEINNIER